MAKKDARIDAYIAKAAPFAKPILTHIRALVHAACPDVEEKMKWSFPHFDYKGMMCSMAGFKQHCAFNFWKAALMKDPKKILQTGERDAMGNLGQIKSLGDLPPDKVMIAYIKEAIQLNDDDVKLPSKPKIPPAESVVPADLTAALKKNRSALKTFEAFSPSHKREYIGWITEAKTDETRARRIATTIEWLAEGKSRNWKYEK